MSGVRVPPPLPTPPYIVRYASYSTCAPLRVVSARQRRDVEAAGLDYGSSAGGRPRPPRTFGGRAHLWLERTLPILVDRLRRALDGMLSSKLVSFAKQAYAKYNL